MTKKQNNKQQKLGKVSKELKAIKKVISKAPRQRNPKQNRQPKSKGILGSILRTAGGAAGAMLGNPGVGTALGAGISRILGHGDYTVKQNSMMAGPPSFAALNQGIRIRHREYLQDVRSSVAFACTQYQIQPTDRVTFPWLSQIATSFEQYKIHGLVFYFNTTAGNAISSTNNALGIVGMATCYDPSQGPFQNKRQCEDYVGCTSAVPSISIMHAVECKPKSDVLDRYYCLQDAITDVEDLKFFNHGTLNLFSVGSQQATTVGELWVSYDIEFFNPKLENTGTDSSADHFYAGGVTATTSKPLGALGYLPLTGSNINSTLTNSILTLPNSSAKGNYMVILILNTTVMTTPVLFTTPTPNLVPHNLFLGDTQNSYAITNSPFTVLMLSYIKTDTNVASVSFTTSSGVTTGPAQFDLFLISVPLALLTVMRSAVKAVSTKDKMRDAFISLMEDFKDGKLDKHKPLFPVEECKEDSLVDDSYEKDVGDIDLPHILSSRIGSSVILDQAPVCGSFRPVIKNSRK